MPDATRFTAPPIATCNVKQQIKNALLNTGWVSVQNVRSKFLKLKYSGCSPIYLTEVKTVFEIHDVKIINF